MFYRVIKKSVPHKWAPCAKITAVSKPKADLESVDDFQVTCKFS